MSSAVAVLGPGAVGGALAVRLARAGLHVIAVASPGTAAAIRDDRLTLVTPDGALTERIEAVERLEQPVALLLVTVKTMTLAEALGRVAASPELVVPLLNGLEHLEPLHARFGPSVAAGSIGTFEAYREDPARIVQTTPGAIVTTSSTRAAGLLDVDGVEVWVEENERLVLWGKAPAWPRLRLPPR